MNGSLKFVLVAAVALPGGIAAQEAPANPTQVQQVTQRPGLRDSWTADRRGVRVGDLLTVIVGEDISANERTSHVARNNRSQGGSISSDFAPEDLRAFGIGYNARSDQTGQAGRRGELDAVLTVRVAAIEPSGVIRIEGTKTLTVDGRNQEVAVAGLVRPEDISPTNTIASARIADATISYKGKKIGPKTGLIGKLVGALWP